MHEIDYNDKINVPSFNVGEEYEAFLCWGVRAEVLCEVDGREKVTEDELLDIISKVTDRYIKGDFKYALYIIMHFGVRNVFDEWEENPMKKFKQEALEEVKYWLEDVVEVIG